MQHLLSERAPSQLPLVAVGMQPSSFMMHTRVRVCVPSPQVLSHSPKLLQTPNTASSVDQTTTFTYSSAAKAIAPWWHVHVATTETNCWFATRVT